MYYYTYFIILSEEDKIANAETGAYRKAEYRFLSIEREN